MTKSKTTKIIMGAMFVVSTIGYMAFTPREMPFLPLVAWPVSYAALAYWLGLVSLGKVEDDICHRAGVRYIPHGVAVGLIVAAAVVAIRIVGVYPLPRRWLSLLVAFAAAGGVYLYLRYVIKATGGGVVPMVLVFGCMPIWNQFVSISDN